MSAYLKVIAVPDLDNPARHVMPKIGLIGYNGPEIPHLSPLCFSTAIEHARTTIKMKSLFFQYTAKKIPEKISNPYKIKNGLCLIKEVKHQEPRSLIICCSRQNYQNENTGYYAIYSSHLLHLQTIVDKVTDIVNPTLYEPILAKPSDPDYMCMHRITLAVLNSEDSEDSELCHMYSNKRQTQSNPQLGDTARRLRTS